MAPIPKSKLSLKAGIWENEVYAQESEIRKFDLSRILFLRRGFPEDKEKSANVSTQTFNCADSYYIGRTRWIARPQLSNVNRRAPC